MSGVLESQTVSGAGDDAIPVTRGMMRIRITGQWNDWDSAYRDSAGRTVKRALLSGVAGQLDARSLPQLQPAESAIQALAGRPAFSLSLGALEARGDVRQSTAPISVDVGLTNRLSLTLLVPYVESRDNTQLILNRRGVGATVGANPAFGPIGTPASGSTTVDNGSAARAINGALLGEISRARTHLAAEITRCGDAAATMCEAIRANPSGAQALLTRSISTANAIATVYGDSARGGSPVVPFAASLLGEQIAGSIYTLRTSFESFGVTTISENSRVVGATSAYGPGTLNALASDSALGLGYNRLGNTRRAGIGDVDLTASYLLFDSFKANQRMRLTSTSRAARALVAVGWRFGSAGSDRALDAFDVPIGSGYNALLARGTGDLIFNRRFWASASVRLIKPFSDNIVVAVPLRTDSAIFTPFSLASAKRSPGTQIEFELAPRISFGDFFGLSAAYLFRRVGVSSLSPNGNSSGVDSLAGGSVIFPAEAEQLFFTETAASNFQAVSFGASFSTLTSYVRNRSKLPLELSYVHTSSISASGQFVPAVSTDRLELRIYTGFSRR